eukprot:CAMPEP_0182826326 /NCGR_PEP_ID=MMETSP0006_2-20121128/16318_2 /TAXON_ID=97485 /ORGANISM="Prymnesium parvum, Strain Texoma1" /LENGTH=100 /DNA_ID=CAMNT_0024953491 /DNA_START=299 /DNA_END=601 /DNA_ORIENTATION=-
MSGSNLGIARQDGLKISAQGCDRPSVYLRHPGSGTQQHPLDDLLLGSGSSTSMLVPLELDPPSFALLVCSNLLPIPEKTSSMPLPSFADVSWYVAPTDAA